MKLSEAIEHMENGGECVCITALGMQVFRKITDGESYFRYPDSSQWLDDSPPIGQLLATKWSKAPKKVLKGRALFIERDGSYYVTYDCDTETNFRNYYSDKFVRILTEVFELPVEEVEE